MAALAELQSVYQAIEFQVGFSSVDQSPVLADIRTAARLEAYEIIEQQRAQLRAGEFHAVGLDVDALSSARAVIETRVTYGADSSEAQERYQGLQLDCSRLFGEAARAKTYEYFEPVLQTLDPVSGDYFSKGYSLTKITEAGLSPVAEPEELERRVNERVEEETYRAIGQLALLGQSLEPEATPQVVRRIRTITECPDYAHEALALGRSTGGYVPEKNKFMVRDVVFYSNGNRTLEQLALPGDLIDGQVIRGTLETKGVPVANASKLELQALQLDVCDTLLEFGADLDTAASKKHRLPILMGEVSILPIDQGSYDAIPIAAGRRQEALAAQAEELAAILVNLEKIGTDHQAANGLVENLVQQMLLKIAEQDPEQAKFSFDDQVAEKFKTAQAWRQAGRYAEADALVAETKAAAPPVSYCGAGSCGLEKGDVIGDNAKTMKDMGLETSGSLKDTERACPKCHKKEIVYDLKNKVKACLHCKAKTGFGRK